MGYNQVTLKPRRTGSVYERTVDVQFSCKRQQQSWA